MHAEDMTHVGFVCCFSLYDLSVLNLEELVFLVSLFPLIPSGSYIPSDLALSLVPKPCCGMCEVGISLLRLSTQQSLALGIFTDHES